MAVSFDIAFEEHDEKKVGPSWVGAKVSPEGNVADEFSNRDTVNECVLVWHVCVRM